MSYRTPNKWRRAIPWVPYTADAVETAIVNADPSRTGWCTMPTILPERGSYVRLRGDLVFRDTIMRAGGDGDLFVVPDGYRFNGASIPRPLWPLIGHPLFGEYVYPSALHDWECEFQFRPPLEVHHRFGRALRASSLTGWRRDAMVKAVVKFGPRW